MKSFAVLTFSFQLSTDERETARWTVRKKERERHCKGEKGREDDDADGGRMKTGEVGAGFCLVAITIQSRRNVCGTKWSVMGNRLQQRWQRHSRKERE